MPNAADFKADARFPGIVANMKAKVGQMAAEHVSKSFNVARADRAMIEKEMAATTLSACFQMLAMDVLIAEEAGMHLNSVNIENEKLRKSNAALFNDLRWMQVRMHAWKEEAESEEFPSEEPLAEIRARIDAKVAMLKAAGKTPDESILAEVSGGTEQLRKVLCRECRQEIGPDDKATCADCMPRVV